MKLSHKIAATAMGTSMYVTAIFTPALAGNWADGYGKTIKQAIEMARKGAELAVKARNGKGCVGPGKNGEPDLRPGKYNGKNGLFHFQAHFNHTNGACGKKMGIAEAIRFYAK